MKCEHSINDLKKIGIDTAIYEKCLKNLNLNDIDELFKLKKTLDGIRNLKESSK